MDAITMPSEGEFVEFVGQALRAATEFRRASGDAGAVRDVVDRWEGVTCGPWRICFTPREEVPGGRGGYLDPCIGMGAGVDGWYVAAYLSAEWEGHPGMVKSPLLTQGQPFTSLWNSKWRPLEGGSDAFYTLDDCCRVLEQARIILEHAPRLARAWEALGGSGFNARYSENMEGMPPCVTRTAELGSGDTEMLYHAFVSLAGEGQWGLALFGGGMEADEPVWRQAFSGALEGARGAVRPTGRDYLEGWRTRTPEAFPPYEADDLAAGVAFLADVARRQAELKAANVTAGD